MIREKVKKLWRLCFDDHEEFIDMYFRLRYNNDVNIAIQSGEEVIAATQMLPYPMTFGNTEIKTAYISGACTHPDYRNRGVMHELLSQAFTQMLRNGVVLSTLIPAEPWLFNYYARNGYALVFNYQKKVFTTPTTPLPNGSPVLKATHEYKQDLYEYLNRKLRERPFCIQHTEQDFQVLIADLKLNRGQIFTLSQRGNIVALAFVYPTMDKGWFIGELLADAPEMSDVLLQRICEKSNIPSIEILTPPTENETNSPLGMARIINAKEMLQLYAATYPEKDLNIHLTDEQVSTNNGYYYLNNGKCMVSAKRLPGSHLALTIGELTEKIFATLNPYMSLMMN